MTLIVHTARVSYGGPDRFDITRKSGGALGQHFAPSWHLLRTYLAKRRDGTISEADWIEYAAQYTDQMRTSFRLYRDEWNALLARETVTLVCYCTDFEHCHRRLLAGILLILGATYAGERS